MYFYTDIKKELEIYSEKIFGDTECIAFNNATLVDEGNANSISWLGKMYLQNNPHILKGLESNILITNISNIELFEGFKGVLVYSKEPRLLFSKILNKLFVPKVEYKIHNSVVLHPEANIHPEVYIGPNCTIGKVKIGKGTTISGNTFIHDNVVIGENCSIDACCVIGADGFGHVKDENNEWYKFPHLGGTIIENNVEIGANTYVTKGALKNTHIKKGVKIALSVCIGHNVVIGENSIVLSNAIIGGSTIVGKDCWISITASIKDGLIIGNKSIVGVGAVVTKNVAPNITVIGNPAKELIKK